MKKTTRYYALIVFFSFMPLFSQTTKYISIDKVQPGQLRYASRNVEQKVDNALKNGHVKKRGTRGYHDLKFDDGKSIIPEKNALPVIRYGNEDRYILVDGHHDMLANITVGGTTFPAKEIIPSKNIQQLPTNLRREALGKAQSVCAVGGDISKRGAYERCVKSIENSFYEDFFWKSAHELGYVYPFALLKDNGSWKMPWQIPSKTFTDSSGRITLTDDPNRYFATIVARKCDFEGQDSEKSTGAKKPLWRKIGKDIPFIEFMIADKMYHHNLIYEYGMEDTNTERFKKLVEETRRVLLEDPISGLKLITKELDWKDIKDLCKE